MVKAVVPFFMSKILEILGQAVKLLPMLYALGGQILAELKRRRLEKKKKAALKKAKSEKDTTSVNDLFR